MSQLLRNLRYAVRLYAKSPGFTCTAVAVLAVGIGLNAAVFTALNALLLQPIAGAPSAVFTTLTLADRTKPGGYESLSYDDYRLVRNAAPTVFASVLAQRVAGVGVSEHGAARRSFAAAVSANYFSTLGASPIAGRAFLPSEEDSPASAVAIVSHAYWRTRGLDPDLLGKQVRINGRDFTIVGVMPPHFSGTMALFSPEFWVPLRALEVTDAAGASGSASALHVVGRLRPGITREQAAPRVAPLAALVNATGRHQHECAIGLERLSRLSVSPGSSAEGETRGVMFFLLGMSSVVLLIATMNLANMLLARGATRQREVGIRLALGAKPRQVLGQLVLEAMVLSAAGGVLGLALANAAVRIVAARIAPALPVVLALDASPDSRVVLATAVFALVSALFFGLGPAWRLVRTDVLPQLKQAPASTRSAGRFTFRNLLVAGQLAMSLALLTTAALFVHGAWQATEADPGFPLAGGITATVDPSLAGYDETRGREAYGRVLARLRAMPGVECASAASVVPFGTTSELRTARRPDRPGDMQWGIFNVVGSDYFKSLRLPVLRGREFTRAEEEGGAARVAIVDETLARRLWPDGNALGQPLQTSDDDATWEAPLQVVGIVPAVRQGMFDRQAEPHVYVPAGAEYRAEMTLHVRLRGTGNATAAMLPQVRRELLAADPRLPVLSVRTLEQHRDGSVYLWIARATARLFTAFALAALALAMLGVYAVKAFLVARQTREIGIRVALGASHADILRLVVGDSLRLVLGGLVTGLAAGIALSRVLTGWVYGLGGLDGAAPVAAALLLAACAVAASYVPARRALKIAPSVALRTE